MLCLNVEINPLLVGVAVVVGVQGTRRDVFVVSPVVACWRLPRRCVCFWDASGAKPGGAGGAIGAHHVFLQRERDIPLDDVFWFRGRFIFRDATSWNITRRVAIF